jgi:hypothetical protein
MYYGVQVKDQLDTYTDASPETDFGKNDGYIFNDPNTGVTWAQCVSASLNPRLSISTAAVGAQSCYYGAAEWGIQRGVMTFTNTIPTGSTLTNAYIKMKCYAASGTITCALVNVASYDGLDVSLYTTIGSTYQSDTTFTVAGGLGWKPYKLNAAGLAGVPIGGNYYCATRDAYYDISGTPPSAVNYWYAYASARAGTSEDEYDSLIYTTASTAKPMPYYLRGPDFRTGVTR